MVGLAPCPDSSDLPYNNAETATIDEGQKLVARFVPEGATTDARLPIAAARYHPGCTYEIRIDGETRYGPATIPPTDIDDLDVTFIPAYQWGDSVEIIIRNVSGGSQLAVAAQIVGWEEVTK